MLKNTFYNLFFSGDNRYNYFLGNFIDLQSEEDY